MPVGPGSDFGLPFSDRVFRWETHRGRQTEFDRIEAGTGSISVANRDGLFDPLNFDSVYAAPGNLLPLRQVKISVNTPAHVDTFHDIFTGYVEDWGEFTRRGPRDATCTVQIVDGFELLNNAQVIPVKNSANGGYPAPEERANTRIHAALTHARWPNTRARRQIATGNVALQAITYPIGSSMLQVIQDAADAEFPGLANFYMDRSGRAVFRGRNFRFNPLSSSWTRPAKLWTFGDSGAIDHYDTPSFPQYDTINHPFLPMANLTYVLNKERLYNYVQITPATGERASGGTYFQNKNFFQQLVKDDASVAHYGKRDLTISGLLVAAGDGPPIQGPGQECKRFGIYYLNNYSIPRVRATQLEVHSKFEDDRLWNFLVNVELNDIVELYTYHPGGGGFFGEQFFVDGIHNVVEAVGHWPQWVGTYDLTPRGYFGDFPPPF